MVKRVSIIILVLIILVASWKLLTFFFGPSWKTVSESLNKNYEVKAKLQKGNATSPGVLGIFLRKLPATFLSQEKEIIRMINWNRDARISFIDSINILISTFNEETDYYKTYFLFSLDHLPDSKMTFRSSDEFMLSDTMSIDTTAQYKIVGGLIADVPKLAEINIQRIEEWGDSLNWELFVLNADSVAINIESENRLFLDVNWINDDWSKNICLGLPELGNGIIESSCNHNEKIK